MKKVYLKALVLLVLIGTYSGNLMLAQFSGGAGTEGNPWHIATVEDFLAMRDAPDWRYFILTDDIDMAGEYFEPLKSANHASQYRGNVDGDGHVIKNLTVTGVSNITGVFKELTGTIKNLGFVNLTVNAEGYNVVGGIIGQSWNNNRHLQNCYIVNGSITGRDFVGGLFGYAWSENNTVQNCFVDAVVTGNSNVGGLFGRTNLTNETAITNNAFYGTISFNPDSVNNGGGGIAGDVFKNSTFPLQSSNYYDSTNVGTEDQGNATKLGAADLPLQASYTELDFATPVWKMWEGHYAVLDIYEPPPMMQGSGTPEDPYLIATVEHLQAIRDSAAWMNYALVTDLDMTGHTFHPLASPGVMAFQANLNGRGHVIRNLVVTPEEGHTNNIGFVRKLQGHIDSLGFENLYVDTAGTKNYTGGIAGQLQGGVNFKITNCFIFGGRISGGDYVGGITGAAWGDNLVENCFVDAVVEGTGWRTCGVVGRNTATVSRCAFYGEVSTTVNATFNRPICELWNTGVAVDCYYDENVGDDEVIGDTALSTEELKLQESYPGLDFATPVWKIWEDNYAVLNFFTPPTPPVSDAGEDQSVLEGTLVTLDGTGSSDINGDDLTYAWTAPEGISLSDSTLAEPTFTAPEVDAETHYEILLMVSDGMYDSENDTVVVTVTSNDAPVADAGDDATVREDDEVMLDGSGSSDADGDDLTYAWTAPGDITLSDPAAVKPTFTAPAVDAVTEYEIILKVNDGIVDSENDTVVITVNPNAVPVADAGDNATVREADEVMLDGSGSSDADGDDLTYAWTAPGGITLSDASAVKPTFTAPDVSTSTDYTFTLVVNDGMDDSPGDDVVITVTANSAPVADAGIADTVSAGVLVTLDGSGSSDADGDDLTYAWTVPAGITLSDETVAGPTFTAPDVTDTTEYTISLVVNDGIDDSDASEVTITVIPLGTGFTNLSVFEMKAYPNPSAGLFTLEVEDRAYVIVSNIIGARVMAFDVEAGANTIDLSELASGQYYLTVMKDRNRATKQIIIKK